MIFLRILLRMKDGNKSLRTFFEQLAVLLSALMSNVFWLHFGTKLKCYPTTIFLLTPMAMRVYLTHFAANLSLLIHHPTSTSNKSSSSLFVHKRQFSIIPCQTFHPCGPCCDVLYCFSPLMMPGLCTTSSKMALSCASKWHGQQHESMSSLR